MADMAGLRLLACFAHPDDEAFPVAGALAAHAARGVEVWLITATSGEEGEIRQAGLATPQTLGAVRRAELARSVGALGLSSHQVLGYRDSGMAGTPANANPQAFVNAPAATVVEQLVGEMRRFRPQVVLTFEPGGLYGHPDHIAICRHATEAFRRASDPSAFPHQLVNGVRPHTPDRLFYSARPTGFRTETALKLRAAGVDFPMPSALRASDGTPPEQINLEMDVSAHLEIKMASILSHRSQVAPDWPYHQVPRAVAADILGREHYIRAWPQVRPGEQVPADFFAGLVASPGV
ncbi:MAG: GlcNAc-PI de-N-acetylase [Dehalococcoidia bacterium]|nr:GlcNAc-PI de-N-acetylase [Dehalococcoidia bacterium]MSQ16986.1 GlcNAc-PI de-N-acetylase [Dehalococcoidia bacterium]